MESFHGRVRLPSADCDRVSPQRNAGFVDRRRHGLELGAGAVSSAAVEYRAADDLRHDDRWSDTDRVDRDVVRDDADDVRLHVEPRDGSGRDQPRG